MIYKCECGQVHDNGINRRDFLGLGAGAVFGYALTQFYHPVEVVAQSSYPVQNTAEYCIVINMNGGPAHSDVFDVKSNWSSPTARVRPDADETRMDVQIAPGADFALPMGLFGELAQHADKMVPVRWLGWSNAHEIGQYWNYTAWDRNPAFQPERPNVGAVVASEFNRTGRRRPTDVLPGFISLNGLPFQNGFLNGQFAPFIVAANRNGLGGLIQHQGQPTRTLYDSRWSLLQQLDAANRGATPRLGRAAQDFNEFYSATNNMMYNEAVRQTFLLQPADQGRYHPTGDQNGSGFGNACRTAFQVIKSDQGTRFIWITVGGWDMHGNIYNSLFGASRNGTGRSFGKALAELVTDLRNEPSVRGGSRTLLDDTLIVINGDFGRTVGRPDGSGGNGINPATGVNGGMGRDHWNRGSVVFIGGGIRGGRQIGQTDATGYDIIDPGWDVFSRTSRRARTAGSYPNAGPFTRTEDAYFSMYSALGINPTTVYQGAPSGRPYEFIYGASDPAGSRYFTEIPLW